MSCQKQKFDLKACRSILNENNKKFKKKWRKETRYYFCEECQAHHLTSKSEWEEPVYLKEEDLVFKEKWLELIKIN